MSNLRRRSSSISSLNSRVGKQISNNQTNKVKSNANNDKKTAFSKPTWDSTTNDLNQLKATQEEIERRKLAHQSKNIDSIKSDIQKKLQPAKSNKKQDTKSQAAQLALLKEILFDDERIRNLINNNTDKKSAHTDNTLKAVQNFFNEQNDFDDDNCSIITNGKRQAKINMTLAPNIKDLNDSTLPVPNELLNKNSSKSVNRRISSNLKINNINDLDQQLYDELPVQDENKSYNNNLIEEKLKKSKQSNDLEKYKQLLELKNKLIESTIKTAVSVEQNQTNKKQTPSAFSSSQLDTTELNLNDLEECLRILTANKKLNKNEDEDNDMNSFISTKNNVKTNNNTITSCNQFENALSELENKLIDFEKLSGKQTSNYTKNNNNNSANVSTYTLTLIKIISNLIDHVKDTSVELNFEKLKSVELNKQLDVNRKLIDGLTNEVLSVKEQNKKLLNGFVNQQAKLEAEMEQMKVYMKNIMSIQMPGQYPIQFHRLSGFSTQSQSSLDLNEMNITNQRNAIQNQILNHTNNNLIQHQQQQQQQQQQSLMIPRPVSCMSSLNTINLEQASSSNNTKQNPADKFSERLNAMLFNNNNNNNNTEPNKSDFRSSFDSLNINRSISSFNHQVQELSFKNVEAQQKLRQALLEQKQVSLSNNEMQEMKLCNEFNYNNNNNQNSNISSSSSSHQQNEVLEKLQKEKKMLKEQIDMLNRQRESAQFELDSLVNNNQSKKTDAIDANTKTNIQNSIMKHLNDINMHEIMNNNSNILSSNTPSLSPIRPEKNM